MSIPNSDFHPTARWEVLQLRAKLLKKLRSFFDERGFLEIETPILSADTIADLHLDPIPVTLFHDPRSPESGRRMWLQTSPEFAMKRLLAAGAERIYQVTKAFRAGESGALHNPEFTIVEWYRLGDSMQAGMNLLAKLTCHLLGSEEVDEISYEEAFVRCLQINPHLATADELTERSQQLGLPAPASLGTDRDHWLNFLLAHCVEPHLGFDRPTILYDYPETQAALARLRAVSDKSDPSRCYSVAERFELYVRGIELANGYNELLDPAVLRERNRIANAVRQDDGRYQVPGESRLLSAMEHGLPASCGVALGFDRLVMVAAGLKDIRDVMAFPIDRA